jgi:hypothetical protein
LLPGILPCPQFTPPLANDGQPAINITVGLVGERVAPRIHDRSARIAGFGELIPEKAGVGGSIPSLATMKSIAYRHSENRFHSVSFQKLWSAEIRISDETWRQDRSGVLSIPPQLELFAWSATLTR